MHLIEIISILGMSAFSYAYCGHVYGRKVEGFILKRIVSITLNDCVKECRMRASCLSLNYNRLYKLCELNSALLSTVANLVEDKKWICYDKAQNSAIDIGNCINHACIADQVCVETNVGYDCVNEGEHPTSIHLENGIIKGNMNDEGSKIAFECIPQYERNGPGISIYSRITGWGSMPMCELVASCSIPSFITSSFLQILMVEMVTEDGTMMYTKENVSTVAQLGEVFENSIIIIQCTTILYETVSTNVLCSDGNWEFSPGCTVADTSCELETSCSNSVTENCISNVCRCDVPTSYSYTQHTCVSSCQNGLASTFTRYEGIGVYNSNFDYHSDVSYNECLAICLMRADCIYFEYGDYNGVGCYIRTFVLINHIDDIGTWKNGAIFSRDCL
ncbi:hypothetical protein ACF0H5_012608 [Mactra antiquata]